MGFRCQICDVPQESGIRPIKLIIKTRPAHYKNFIRLKDDPEKVILKETDGLEIVAEKAACKPCADKFNTVASTLQVA